MPEKDFIKDITLKKEDIDAIDNTLSLDVVEKTVNENVELLRGKFVAVPGNLQQIEQNVDSKDDGLFAEGIEKIFDNWLTKNPDVIGLVISLSNVSAEKEKKIEDIVATTGVDLNTRKNLTGIKNELDEIGKKNTKATERYTTPPELTNAIEKVETAGDIPIQEMPKLKDLIMAGKFSEAITLCLTFIGEFIFGKKGKVGLEEYKDLDTDILAMKLESKELAELSHMIQDMDNKIDEVRDISKKMRFTYILTAIKNASFQKEEAKGMTNYELLLKDLKAQGKTTSGVEAGQILLINKENKKYKSGQAKIGDKLLSTFNKVSGYGTGFLHSVVVSRIEGDEIYITHSTLQRKDGTPGVEEKKLSDLLGGYSGADILVLDMPDTNKEKLLGFTKNKLDEQNKDPDKSLYDKKSVIQSTTGYGQANLDLVNCVELISGGLGDEKIKGVSIPNELLGSNILRPSYLTSI